MTDVLITCDTELSAALHQKSLSQERNIASSIWGEVDGGSFGIGWQMDRLERHGLRGVFFVDPMPALLYGRGFLDELVGTILSRGHEVQLHIHTEWLEWIEPSPVSGRVGRNIGDFDFADQLVLLSTASDLLTESGAPRPVAFRAGNYGADDTTLRALAALGFSWDSSFNPCFLGNPCRVKLPVNSLGEPRYGVGELPISSIYERRAVLRPAQVCALSAREMRAGLRHAARSGHGVFVIVTHSFEMLSRDRSRPNYTVMRRFEAMCEEISRHPDLNSTGFVDLDWASAFRSPAISSQLPANRLRTSLRMLAQAMSTIVHERRIPV